MEQQPGKPRRPRGSSQQTYARALATLASRGSKPPTDGDDAAQYSIAQALKYSLETTCPKPGRDLAKRITAHGAKASMALILDRFWQDKTIGDATPDNRKAYYAHRQAEADRQEKKLNTNGRKGELSHLRGALKTFIEDHKLRGSFDLHDDTKAVGFARTPISRDDLARLLWAARGRRWNTETKRWHPCPPWDADHLEKIRTDPAWIWTLWLKRERKHVARAMLLCAYTTSVAMCVTRLHWTKTDARTSYVDLDVAFPVLYRLGDDAMEGKFAGEPVLLNRRIVAHLKRWRKMDADSGWAWVIHYHAKKSPLAHAPTQAFRNIQADAGLPAPVRFNDLRFSAGAHIAETDGMVLRSGALLMGIKTEYFIEVYRHLAADFQQAIMNAFERKPGQPIDKDAVA